MLKAIIFDKDGTLLDFGEAWDGPSVALVNDLLAESDLTSGEQQQLVRDVGIQDGRIQPNTIFSAGSVREQAEFLANRLNLNVNHTEKRIEAHFAEAMKTNAAAIQVIPGVYEVLDKLSKHYYLGLVTNDNKLLTETSLEIAGLTNYFEFIGSADEYGEKPAPTALQEIERLTGITLNQMVYVGDSIVDMEYGLLTKAAIGYASNEDQKNMLREASYVFQRFEELPTIFKKINKVEGVIHEKEN